MVLEIPLWAAGPEGTEFEHSAFLDRRLIEGIFDSMGGVIGDTSFRVVQRAAGSNMSVDIQPGRCVVPGMHVSNQGSYYNRSTSVQNRTVAAAPGTGTRTDLVVARVYDSEVQGLVDKFEIEVITGSTVVPNDAIPLAEITVASGTAAIINSMINDVRPHAMIRMELLMEYATKSFVDSKFEPLDVAQVTTGTASALTLNVPSGIGTARVVGYGRSNASGTHRTSLRMSLNGVTTGDTYRSQRMEAQGDTGPPGVGGGLESHPIVGYIAGADAIFGIRGWLDLLVVAATTGRPQTISFGGSMTTSSDSDSRMRWSHTVSANGPVNTITLRPTSGSFVAGTYYELVRA